MNVLIDLPELPPLDLTPPQARLLRRHLLRSIPKAPDADGRAVLHDAVYDLARSLDPSLAFEDWN